MPPKIHTLKNTLLSTFISENRLMASKFNEFKQAENYVVDPNNLTDIEAIDIFNETDLDLLRKGIKDEAILIMHGITPSEKNVQTLRWCLKNKFYATKNLEMLINSPDITPYEIGLIINKAFTPQLQKDSPYVEYAETQLGYYDHYRTSIYKNDVAKFGRLYYDENTMMSYHSLNLLKQLSKCGKEENLDPIDQKWETLISIKQELDILNAYEDYDKLPDMVTFIYHNNPTIFKELNLKFTQNQLYQMTGKTICTLLIAALEQLIQNKPYGIDSEDINQKNNDFDRGYKKALDDILNEGFEDLSGMQRELLERKLGRHSAIQYEVDDEILNSDKPKPQQIQITLDGNLI